MNKSMIAMPIPIVLFVSLLSVAVLSAQELRDIIQLVKIHPEKADTVLVSDMFYAKRYDLRFKENNKIDVSYDPMTTDWCFLPSITSGGRQSSDSCSKVSRTLYQ
jgi:hypothetical protein